MLAKSSAPEPVAVEPVKNPAFDLLKAHISGFVNSSGASVAGRENEPYKTIKTSSVGFVGTPSADFSEKFDVLKAHIDALKKPSLLKANKNHDPVTGRFMSGSELADYLLNGDAINISGREFAEFSEPLDMKAMRHLAKVYAKNNVVGSYKNQKSGIRLDVHPAGVDQSISHGGGPDKLKLFAAIPSLLQNGVVVFDGDNPKHEGDRLVVVAHRVMVAGDEFMVTAGFREDVNGRLFYDHELVEMERAERLSSQWDTATQHSRPPAHLNDYTIRFLSQATTLAKSVYRASHEPTRPQLEAGNYKKRKLQWRGLTIAIENEPGSVRRKEQLSIILSFN